MGRTLLELQIQSSLIPEKFTLSKLFVMMHSKKRQKVSSFLGDKLTTSFRQGTSEISTVKERRHIYR